MAYPTIVIDNSGGGTEGQVSGCGPSTAVYGTGGCTAATGETATRVGFVGASALTGVAADHVLYLGTGSTNRRYSQITAVSDATAATSNSSESAAAQAVIALTDPTGFATGDIIQITDGVHTEYHIVTISGSNATCASNLAYTYALGSTVTRPRQVTVADSMTLALSGKNWAIGGKLPGMTYGTHTESLRVFADGKAGWTIDIKYGSGTYDLGNAGITLSANGSAAARLKIVSSSTTGPTLSTGSSVQIFTVSSGGVSYLEFSNLALQHTATKNVGIRADTVSAGSVIICERMTFTNSYGIYANSDSGSLIEAWHCIFKDCSSAGLRGLGTPVFATGCLFYSSSSAAGYGFADTDAGSIFRAKDCVFYNLAYGAYSNGNRVHDWAFDNCTFHTITTDGVKCSSTTATNMKLRFRNCLFYGIGGYGVNPSVACSGLMRQFKGCAYGSCTSGFTNTTYLDAPSDAVALSGDPCVNAATLDFRLDATTSEGAACRGVGYPSAVPYSTTRNDFGDIGALQRSFPTLPTAAQVQTGVAFGDDGTQYTGTYAGGQMQAYPLVVAGPQYVG